MTKSTLAMDGKIGPMAVLVAAGQVMAVDRYDEKMKKMTKSTLAMVSRLVMKTWRHEWPE